MQNINNCPRQMNFLLKFIASTFIFIISIHFQSFGQCNQGSTDCSDSPIIDLPFVAQMPSAINGGGNIPGCGNQFSFHNTSWFRITPSLTTTNLRIRITTSNCTSPGNGPGIQVGMYTACDPNLPPVGTVQCECIVGTVVVGGPVTPGVDYYIMVDGCDGSACRLTMTVEEGAVQTPIVNLGTPEAPTTNTPFPLCTGQELTFMVPPVENADDYVWNFPPGVTVLSQECNQVTVIWGNTGGDVTVDAINVATNQSNTSPPTTVPFDALERTHFAEYCEVLPSTGQDSYTFFGDNQQYTEGVYPMITVSGPMCDTTYTLTVVRNAIEVQNIIVVEPTCNQNNINFQLDGQASIIMVNHGADNYTYEWEDFPGLTGGFNDALYPGDFAVTVTDGRGCTLETIVSVGQPPAMNAADAVFVTQFPMCGPNGEITILENQMGGTPPYEYVWDDNTFIGPRTDLAAGFRTLTIIDNNGCETLWEMNIPDDGGNITATETNNTPESCMGANNGAVTLSVAGDPSATFTWPDGTVSASRNDLSEGTYVVTIANAGGCSGTQTVVIGAGTASFTVDASNTTGVQCASDMNGSLNVSVNGATGTITYDIGNGPQNSNVFNGLAPGNGTVIVTDGNGCQVSTPFTIPAAPNNIMGSVSAASVLSICNGANNGSVTITASGGTGTLRFDIGNGPQNSNVFNDLVAGNYLVNVIDANGCSIDTPIPVDITAAPAIMGTVDPASVLAVCDGANGSATINASGGTGTLMYDIGNGPQTSNIFPNLGAGNYIVNITDANNCFIDPPISFAVNASPAITGNIDPASVLNVCNGASSSVTIIAGGGSGNLMFDIGNGPQSSNIFPNLGDGTYTVNVTDANNCSIDTPISFTITEADEIMGNVDPVSVLEVCDGATGAATINASGGTGTLMFDIGNGPQTSNEFPNLGDGNYSVNITDANGCSIGDPVEFTVTASPAITGSVDPASVLAVCDGANGSATIIAGGGTGNLMFDIGNGPQASNIFPNLGAGNYVVNIIDANNCTIDMPVGFTIDASPAIIGSLDPASVLEICEGENGSATITASGGSGTLMFDIGNGPQTSNEFPNLSDGDYSVNVTDENGCAINDPIEFTVNEADAIIGSVDPASVLEVCNGDSGSATITASGGTGTLMFDIGNGPQISNEFPNLVDGDYSVNITDENGCAISDPVEFTVNEADGIIGSVDPASVLAVCDGANGSATINASGGTGNLMFDIGNGPQTDNVFPNLTAGNYSVEITDENNCTINTPVTFNIDVADAIIGNIDPASVLEVCEGENGSATITASGGTGTLMYDIGNGPQNSNVFPNLGDGDYIVNVTDENGCAISDPVEFTINEADAIIGSVDPASVLEVCNGDSGSATITASGGTGTLMFDIGNGPQISNEFPNLVDGDYSVNITDENGCAISDPVEFTVNEADGIIGSVDPASVLAVCDGANGSATINASGGTGTLMFDIGNGPQTDNVFPNLTAGNYSVEITDENNCTINTPVSFSIDEADAIIGSVDPVSLLDVCNGESGSANITASGGTGTLMYDIGNGPQTSNEFPNLGDGDYSVNITDENGCAVSDPVEFTVNEADEITGMIDAASTLQVCDGDDGAVTVIASGGTGTLMYDIGNGPQTSNVFTDIPPGDFVVNVTDANGCGINTPVPFSIIAASAITATVDATSALEVCSGENGSASINASGGTGTLMYDIGNGPQDNNVFDNLAPGMYVVDITDQNGCSIDTPVEFEVEASDQLIAVVAASSDLIVCGGATDGTATIEATGGNQTYSYNIGNGPQDSPTFNNLSEGMYTTTVTDGNGCTGEIPFSVEPAPGITATVEAASSDLTICSGAGNGIVSITATGGDGNFMYDIGNGPQTSNVFMNLPVGDYTIIVTDGNECEEPEMFSVEAAPQITYETEITNVSCFGEATGSATITPTGGEGPFEYLWSNDQNTNNGQNLAMGDYTLTITDANDCEEIVPVSIGQPISALTIDPNPVISPAVCGELTGSVEITVSGGTGNYTYLWSNGATTPNLTGVGSGNYNVTVTDMNNCPVESVNYNVSEPGALTTDPIVADADCNDSATGSINLNVSGGTAPYTYDWSDDPMAAEQRTNLAAGIYSIIVGDADGCILDQFNITIAEPEPLTATLTPTMAGCGVNDGSVALVVNGGSGDYTYEWSNGATTPNLNGVFAGNYSVIVRDENMCTFTSDPVAVINPGVPELMISGTDVSCFGESTGSIMLDINGGSGGNTITWNEDALNGLTNPTNLSAGTYSVTVTDNSMCEATETFTINEPATAVVIEPTAAIDPATCGDSNGSITISVSGGTGDYTYLWSNGATTPNLINVGPANYTVTVTDMNNCMAISENYNVSEPGALTTDPMVAGADCNGSSTGSINLNVDGGTSPYTVTWSDIGVGNATRTDLPSGTYSVVVSDSDGCALDEISLSVEEPDPITVVGTATMSGCGESTGSINITVSGGSEDYTFEWSDGTTTTEDLNNAPAGENTVIITDSNGCQTSFTETITNPNPPTIALSFEDVLCNNTATGSALVAVSGGTGAYTYDWSDTNFTGQDNPTTLPAGIYTVVVTDELNCSATETFEIGQPDELVLTLDNLEEATCGMANGSVAITVTGGVMPYTYDWSNDATTEDLAALTPGEYELNFTDGNGCAINQSFSVLEPDALMASTESAQDVVCPGGNDGSLTIVTVGGNAPYTYTWNTADTDSILTDLTAGTYTLLVEDADGCTFDYAYTINEPDMIQISGTTENAVCGESNGSISLDITGGNSPYIYQWDNGADPVEDPDGLPAGVYNLVLTDVNGCQAEPYSIVISSPNSPVIDVASTPISCNGASDGTIDLTISGGTGDVTITWNNPAFNNQTSASDLPAGDYIITAEDEVGCVFTAPVTLSEPQLLEAFVVNAQSSTSCNGSSDGSIDLTVQGGTGDYTFEWNNGAENVEDPENLSAGTYEVIVTDENGCTATDITTITEPLPINISADPIAASCSNTEDGGINVSVSGGTGDYTYEWNGGAFDEANLSGVAPGNYTLVVADQNNCQSTVEVNIPAPLSITVNVEDISLNNGFNTSCSDEEDAFIVVSATGGNSGFSYEWNDGTEGARIDQIGQGSYFVIATDEQGCTGSGTFDITSPAPLVLDVTTDGPDCAEDENGVIVVNNVSGGQLPYRYSISNTYVSSPFFGNLASGNYTVIAEDANGCFGETDVVVEAANPLTVSLGSDTTIVLGDSLILFPDFNIPVTDSSYTWSVGFDNDTLQGLRPSVQPMNTISYSIEVTDEFGCTASDQIFVTVEKPRLIYIPNAFRPDSGSGNDRFMISGGQDVDIINRIEIYNRWGEVVYSDINFPTDSPDRSWDGFFRGKLAQSGVYVYVITASFLDGHTETYSGDVTLMR